MLCEMSVRSYLGSVNTSQDPVLLGSGTKTSQRRLAIETLLLQSGEAEFETLARHFAVSEMTIRRDAEQLEVQGTARRVRGGIISTRGRGFEPAFDARSDQAAATKRALAGRVVPLLSPQEVVILDSGSTVLAVAREARLREIPLTVITPSVLVALEISEIPGSNVNVTGGTLRVGERALVGPEAEDYFTGLNCDTFVAGVAGIDAERGLSEYSREEARVKQAALRSARRVIVVADKSKLGRVYLVSLADLSDIDILVTDASMSDPTVQACVQAGVEVLRPKADNSLDATDEE